MNSSIFIVFLFFLFDVSLYSFFKNNNSVVQKNPLIYKLYNKIVDNKNNSEFVKGHLEDIDKTVDDSWWKKEQIRRKLKIKEACSTMNPRRVDLNSFLYDSTHQLFYCKNAKVRHDHSYLVL